MNKNYDLPPLESENDFNGESILEILEEVIPGCKVILAAVAGISLGGVLAMVFPPHEWLWPLLGLWQ
tara:strand:+ start:236 stop:436 length:201 start_codon:yes stop_codon:yes gene_type:complete